MTKVKEPNIFHNIMLNYFNNFKYCYNQNAYLNLYFDRHVKIMTRSLTLCYDCCHNKVLRIFRYILNYCWYYSMLCRYYHIIYNVSRRNIIIKINTKPILAHTNVNKYVFKVFFITNYRIHYLQWIVKRCRYDYNIIVVVFFIEFYPFNY